MGWHVIRNGNQGSFFLRKSEFKMCWHSYAGLTILVLSYGSIGVIQALQVIRPKYVIHVICFLKYVTLCR